MDKKYRAKITKEIQVAIEKIINEHCEEEEYFKSIGWIGNNLFSLMAESAMIVLEASNDVQKYLDREGLLSHF